jgi:uncharacterized protein (DUF4415 family)
MTEKKKSLDEEWVDPDDAPDLSTPEWQAKFDSVEVSRGRPLLPETKTSTTIRLDADVIQRFKAKGPKWQTRINQALREWLDKAG